MAEGELYIDNMKENRARVKFIEANPNQQRLLARLYVIAEAWAQLKGFTLEDVEVVNPKLTNDDRVFFFDMKINDNAKQAKKMLGITNEFGEVIA